MENKLRSYNDLKISVVRLTKHPELLIKMACDITQKKETLGTKEASFELLQYLIRANHTSVLEHASITVLISGVSRSFLAQITRHRMSSFTSASQHYQEYSQYENIVHPDLVEDADLINGCAMAEVHYKNMVDRNLPVYEARQVLPNAKAVNILWTINARSLINFLNQRMCRRNVPEMLTFAEKMYAVCLTWWRDLFLNVGPDCDMWGQCRQGKMRAKECDHV